MKPRRLRVRALWLSRSEWLDWTLLAALFAAAHALLVILTR